MQNGVDHVASNRRTEALPSGQKLAAHARIVLVGQCGNRRGLQLGRRLRRKQCRQDRCDFGIGTKREQTDGRDAIGLPARLIRGSRLGSFENCRSRLADARPVSMLVQKLRETRAAASKTLCEPLQQRGLQFGRLRGDNGLQEADRLGGIGLSADDCSQFRQKSGGRRLVQERFVSQQTPCELIRVMGDRSQNGGPQKFVAWNVMRKASQWRDGCLGGRVPQRQGELKSHKPVRVVGLRAAALSNCEDDFSLGSDSRMA